MQDFKQTLSMAAEVIKRFFAPASFKIENTYHVQCFNRHGRLMWQDWAKNDVVNVGLDEILDKFWKGSTYTASHFVGLTDTTPTVAAGDTMGTHAGWVDTDVYSNSTRPALAMGTVASQSVTSSAAVFNCNAGGTIGGAFVTTDNTVSGTAGILIGVAAFTGGDRVVADSDTLNVTVTSTAATA